MGKFAIAERLVRPVQEKLRLAGRRVEVEAVVVPVEIVAVPVAGQRLDGREGEVLVDIENLLQPRPALLQVRLLRRRDELAQVLPLHRVALVLLRVHVDLLHEAAVVQIAFRRLLVKVREEIDVERLLEHIEPEVAPLEFHQGMRAPRRRHPRRARHLTRDLLVQEAVVLRAVVQVPLQEAAPPLGAAILVHGNREARLLIGLLKGAGGAFALHRHPLENVLRLEVDHHRIGIAARVFFQVLVLLGDELEHEPRQRPLRREELVDLLPVQLRLVALLLLALLFLILPLLLLRLLDRRRGARPPAAAPRSRPAAPHPTRACAHDGPPRRRGPRAPPARSWMAPAPLPTPASVFGRVLK